MRNGCKFLLTAAVMLCMMGCIKPTYCNPKYFISYVLLGSETGTNTYYRVIHQNCYCNNDVVSKPMSLEEAKKLRDDLQSITEEKEACPKQ